MWKWDGMVVKLEMERSDGWTRREKKRGRRREQRNNSQRERERESKKKKIVAKLPACLQHLHE